MRGRTVSPVPRNIYGGVFTSLWAKTTLLFYQKREGLFGTERICFPPVKLQRELSWQDDDVFRLTLDSFFFFQKYVTVKYT